MVAAVVFDMDGVIIDSEQVWDEVREELVADWGGRPLPEAQQAMMGMSSPEWSRYMHEELGLSESPEEINDEVVRLMLERYRGMGGEHHLDAVGAGGCCAVERRQPGILDLQRGPAKVDPPRSLQHLLDVDGLHGAFDEAISCDLFPVVDNRHPPAG